MFTLVSLVTVVLLYLDGWSLVRKIVEIFGVILGLATAAYTGILLSFPRGVPFWHSGFLPWLFVLSGVLTGLAIAVVRVPFAAVFMPKAFGDFKEMWDTTKSYAGLIEYTDKIRTDHRPAGDSCDATLLRDYACNQHRLEWKQHFAVLLCLHPASLSDSRSKLLL